MTLPLMTYEELLKGAPAHDTNDFLDYLRYHNKVVFDNPQWLVIENFKYHKPSKPWLTAFHKTIPYWKDSSKAVEWYDDIDILWYHNEWGTWNWLKKSKGDQTVKRFHIHIYK